MVKAKNTTRGGEATRQNVVRTPLDDIEARQLERIKKHYGFLTDADVVRALIKRAVMSLPSS